MASSISRVKSPVLALAVGGIVCVVSIAGMYAAIKNIKNKKRCPPIVIQSHDEGKTTANGFLINAVTVATALAITTSVNGILSSYHKTINTTTITIINIQVAVISSFAAYFAIYALTGDDQGI